MIEIQIVLLVIGIVLLLGVLLSKLSSYIGIPTLIVFLLIGLFFNANQYFHLSADFYRIIQDISIFALIIIIFSGGLDTNTGKIKPIIKKGIILSTIGTFITAIVSGLLIHYILRFDLILSFLIGSIISSTDAAAIFSIFKSDKMKLKSNLPETLEVESASNDAMAYILMISFLQMIITPETSIMGIFIVFAKSLIIGGVFGYIFGKLSAKLIESIDLNINGLYPVLLLSLAILSFTFSEILTGNGFLAVYISGLLIGNAKLPYKTNEVTFFDGLAWVMQIIMFLLLGLFTFPKQLISNTHDSLIISIILLLIARPLSVFISMIPFKTPINEKIFLSWTGIKGAVPIVFATYPLVMGIPNAEMIFNIVFFVTIISVILQGGTVKYLAKKLNLININIK
ncbi:MAG: potassium/proton antiporter [Methanobrevibacter sp.]|jgi:cell volume regulation protein A|nr:potassium/proton antiporter [Methanobrevibacter sp.]